VSEYNTLNQKLTIRDKLKDKRDAYDFKITDVQSEKFSYQNKNPQAQSDLDLKIARLNRESESVAKEFNFQNKQCFDVMSSLISNQHKMLNPVLTKFLTLNTIYFSKSVAIFSSIGSIDPNAGLTAQLLDGDSSTKAQRIS